MRWLLPEHVEDVLPAEAAKIEALRRALLDLFASRGYELVMPPLLEYLDSLLTGTGHDLDLRTFKLVDQLSGKMMGVRADITPQVARIDAHLLNRKGVTRLCYCGSVLHTLPNGMNRTREPLQIGAELYGHKGIESDIEIQRVMMKALATAGVASAALDLGHVAVFRTLIQRGEVPAEIRRSVELWIGCVAGALEESEYRAKLAKAGFEEIDVEPTRIYSAESARDFLAGAGLDAAAIAAVDGKFISAFVRARKPAP